MKKLEKFMRYSINRSFTFVLSALAALLILMPACERDVTGLEPAPYPTFNEVFTDGFGPGVEYGAFLNSYMEAIDVVDDVVYEGDMALAFTVPDEGSSEGWFAGGYFYTGTPWDLREYDAMTFWARAEKVVTVGEVGFGAGAEYSVAMSDLTVTTIWKKFVIPIPDPSKLSLQKDLFYVSIGADGQYGFKIWFDEVVFEKLGTMARPRPVIPTQTVKAEVGDTLSVSGVSLTMDVAGKDQTMSISSAFLDYVSSADSVIRVDANGDLIVVGTGTAELTAMLGDTEAEGKLTVKAVTPPPLPDVTAPVPDVADSMVISLFSAVYDDVPVDKWSADWDMADYEQVAVNGDSMKMYKNLTYAAVEFTNQTIEASEMTRFHLDVYTPDGVSAGHQLIIKLADFGADGAYAGGDDREAAITFDSNSDPALVSSQWMSFDIPLNDLNLGTREHLAQLVLEGSPNTIYVDNMYFYFNPEDTVGTGGGGGGGEGSDDPYPTTAAPTPTYAAGDVISIFSDPYTDITVDVWSPEWDLAHVIDTTVAGDDVKKYTFEGYSITEFTTDIVDATGMTHFSVDMWTPDAVDGAAVFKIKLVDFGANGAYGGGDDTEHELIFTSTSSPALVKGGWVTFNIPLSDFSGLTTRGHVAQLIFSGGLSTIYFDNMLFHK